MIDDSMLIFIKVWLGVKFYLKPKDKTSLNFEFINHLSLCDFISWMEA